MNKAKHKTLKNRGRSFFAASLIMSMASAAQAQSEGFADDFTVDTTRYSNSSFNDSSGIRSTTYVDGALKLSSTGTDSGPGSNNIDLRASTDRLRVVATLSSETQLVESESYAGASVFVQAFLFNDTYSPDAQTDDVGEIMATVTLDTDQFGNMFASYCLSRISEDGLLVNLDFAGPRYCGRFAGSELLQLDTQYTFELALDRASKQISLSVGELVTDIDWPGEMYLPVKKEQRIQVWQSGVPGTAVGLVHSISTDEFEDDFSEVEPIFNRYRLSNSSAFESILWGNERLAFTTIGTDEKDAFAALNLIDTTDYVESIFELSSDSDISQAGARSGGGLEFRLFSDPSTQGNENQEGDIRATIAFDLGADGLRRAEYCLVRFAQQGDREGLLGDNRRCQNMSLRVEFDKAYRTSIEFDRSQSIVRFRVDGLLEEVPVLAEYLSPSERLKRVFSYARRNSTALMYIDDLRTTPTAVTASEIAAGFVDAPPFPDPIDSTQLQVESDINYEFDFSNTESQLDFIDDFSGASSDIGFWGGRERGGSGVYWQDGAVVLETNTAENNENGNYTEFYLDPKTDSVEAVIGLSSRTNLPPTNDTGAEIQVRATFFNDTQDYGFNGQDGDFEASVKISLGSDGRRRFRANLRRRDVDGRSGDDLLSDNQELEDGLLSLVPELDKDYRIMLRIDRENQVLTFGIDDNTFDYQIPTGVFLPNQRRAIISVNQWGPSGIAVGRIVSIKTNTFAEDFSQSAPVLAPYRPNFSAQHPGRVVEVVDGRLRLEADGALSSGRDPRLVALSASDYVGADIELSSESTLLADGEVLVEVSGTFYNDLPAEARDPETPNIGNVFAKVSVIREGDNSMHAQYCAFRVNDQNFDSLTELLGGDEKNCPQFMDLPALDTAYPAFVKFDRQAATLTFGFNGAEVVYNITTTMSATRPFNGVKASTSDGSKVVAWVDDLAFSENAVPLSMSESQLVFDASAQPSEPAGSGNGSGNGGGDGERPLNDGTNSTGGSGCSVGVRSGGFDPTLLFMFFLAMLICGNRMRRKI